MPRFRVSCVVARPGILHEQGVDVCARLPVGPAVGDRVVAVCAGAVPTPGTLLVNVRSPEQIHIPARIRGVHVVDHMLVALAALEPVRARRRRKSGCSSDRRNAVFVVSKIGDLRPGRIDRADVAAAAPRARRVHRSPTSDTCSWWSAGCPCPCSVVEIAAAQAVRKAALARNTLTSPLVRGLILLEATSQV